jgi:hypothetical protein
VVALELLIVVEEECERVVDTYRREMVTFRIGTEAKNACKKLCRCPLVAGRDDGVVEGEWGARYLATFTSVLSRPGHGRPKTRLQIRWHRVHVARSERYARFRCVWLRSDARLPPRPERMA